jgi:hypothetical protein
VTASGLPTIPELVAEAARSLAEPFSRAALINWVSARRPDVGVSSIAKHIRSVTATPGADLDDAEGPAARRPLLRRVDRGLYERYRGPVAAPPPGQAPARVVLVGSSGAHGPAPAPAAELFASPGFAAARGAARASGWPWFVLSAKHGVLEPGDVVGPFDLRIDERSASYRAAWGEWVAAQLAERMPLAGATVEVHGGVDFAQPLRAPLSRRGASLDLPLPGSWRSPGTTPAPEPAPADDVPAERAADDAETPVRAVLHRLRTLVVGTRGGDGDGSSGHASAS